MLTHLGADGCWCAPRSSKPLQVVKSCPGGFDSHMFPPWIPIADAMGIFNYDREMQAAPMRRVLEKLPTGWYHNGK